MQRHIVGHFQAVGAPVAIPYHILPRCINLCRACICEVCRLPDKKVFEFLTNFCTGR